MNIRSALARLLLVAGVAAPGAASAASFLSRASFAAATTGVVTETFDGYPSGSRGTSFTFANATATSSDPFVIRPGADFCGGSRCLSATSFQAPRTFGDFAAGTTAFGFDLAFASTGEAFRVTAVTGSGTEIHTLSYTDRFFGIADSSGIVSVSVVSTTSANLGFAFDNVSTGLVLEETPGPLRTRAAFLAAAGTGAISTETFESYPSALTGSPFTFSNATVSSTDPLGIFDGRNPWCGGSRCLSASSSTAARIFNRFADDTVGFAFDMGFANAGDTFSVTAVTGSGTYIQSVAGSQRFYGLTDDSGILSVTVRNVTTNGIYSLDNISTVARAEIAGVPEPETWGLLLTGMVGTGASLRSARRRGAGRRRPV